MKAEELVDRAWSQCGLPTKYRMGGGKIVPEGDTCHDERGSADCSAFVDWCLGLRKYQGSTHTFLKALNGGWLNTDGIWWDAVMTGVGFFEETLSGPELGAAVVYPAKWVLKTADQLHGWNPKVGHVGVVTGLDPLRVVHCSNSNWRGEKDAIGETDAAVFERVRATQFVRCTTVEEAPK